jgi:ubiquitin carboxyl-terminal hydrolase 7
LIINRSTGTNEFIRTFGWKSLNWFMKNDVQEFNLFLHDKLESKMKVRGYYSPWSQMSINRFPKGTAEEGPINKLFVGKMKSYVKCINVEYESSQLQQFFGKEWYFYSHLTPTNNPLGIQLNVKGMKNLRESFRDYVKVETLEGDNKYEVEGFGPQDAKKGVIFQSFPPVLNLHLKRFEYEAQRDAMIKVRLELHQ